ncbi:MAG TPA: hypothetical protein VEZ14_05880 [Dehalococcoidia bacterium]|nr:hypothetical protein [Dehalococcoidia bacterium]
MAIQRDLTSIVQIEDAVASLDHGERARFERIFTVSSTEGRLVPPDAMLPWIEKQFGSVDATRFQRIIKVTNVVTLEGVLFNWLRSSRPMWHHEIDLDAELSDGHADPLNDPYNGTPEDLFGRVRGKYCVTASNIAKFDGFHGLVVFNERHPLRFTREMLHDYIDTGGRWGDLAHASDLDAKYYMFLWNCLWRAGASLLHGHAQVIMGRDMHYAAVEHLRRSAAVYQAHHRANYFNDLFLAHESLGCAFEKDGTKVIANLAPKKENEVLLLAPFVTTSLKDRIYEVLACFRDRMGISSFNLVIYTPPWAETEESWEGFPVVVRIVDRGDPSSRTADFGAMELYAQSVVSSDPFVLARGLREALDA